MNKPFRNQSAQTVPRQTQPLTFIIYYEDEQVLKITMKNPESTIGELLDSVRLRLSNRFENIMGLASVQGYYTLDYYLTCRNYRIDRIRNHQKLQILLEEVVADLSSPSLADFTFLACLGQGISASVYLVRHCSNGKLYALKHIQKQYFKEFKTLECVLRERKIMSELIVGMPFATQLQASFESYKHLNFLLQFYPGGEFFYHLSINKLTEYDAKVCFAEIVLAMQQLHKKKILYRDLKPENIMVDIQGHLRIGDFGMCRINLEREDVVHSHCGSPEYMAFETKQDTGYSYAADFYTMGAIIYQMVKGVPPYYNTQEPPEFSNTSQGFREIVLSLIERDPSQRMTSFNQVKKTRWMKEIDWNKVARKEYKKSIKPNLYSNYIHAQFLEIPISNEDLKYEQKYDKLLTPFFYVNSSKDGVGIYYPQANKSSKTKKKSQIRENDGKSNRSKSKSSKNSSKSKDSKFKRDQNMFKRKNLKDQNLYTSPQAVVNRQSTKEKNQIVNKSLSKNKNITPTLLTNRSPLKFNKIGTVKSSGNLKAPEYARQIVKQESKRKKFL